MRIFNIQFIFNDTNNKKIELKLDIMAKTEESAVLKAERTLPKKILEKVILSRVNGIADF